jgi:hypothetical protein
MSNYYYLVSSLPILFFHHGLPVIRYKSFMEDCRRLMNRRDFNCLSFAKLNSDHFYDNATGTFMIWQKISFALRNELVRLRAKKLNIDPQQFIRPYYLDQSLSETVKDNIEDFTPLHAELHLMELQWKLLDYLQSGHHFDLEFLIIYSLKLQLLERKVLLGDETGKTRFESIIKGSE